MKREEEINKQALRYGEPEYLLQTPNILGSQGFVRGAKWADKTMIDKVCEWIKENLPNRMYDRNCCLDNFTEYLIEDLRKYLEE